MSEKNIKVIAFDIGGVLTKTNFKGFYTKLDNLAKEYNINPHKFHKRRSKYSKKFMIGKFSDKEFKRKVLNNLDVKNKKEFIIKWGKALESSIKIDKEVYSLIYKLKKNYITLSFSNVTPMFHKIRLKKEVYRHFKYNILSHQIGLRKPLIKFYRLLIKKAKAKPNEIIFIDNDYDNLTPARDLGINTILYKNSKQLTKDLKKLGIKIK